MAITLQLTDGTTTVDFSNSIVEYTPKSPRKQNDQDSGAFTETIRADLSDTTLALAITKCQNVEYLLGRAEEYENSRGGVPVYLKFCPDGSRTLVRARVLGGSIDYHKDALNWMLAAFDFEVAITLARVPYWEADSETELGIANGSHSKTTGGLTIYNHDDATPSSHDNYVEIEAADVAGVADAAVRIELTNTFATSSDLIAYIGRGAWEAFTNFLHILEGELASVTSPVTLTATDDATCSGTGGAGGIGQYGDIDWTGDTDAVIAKWALSADQVQACAGQPMRLLARFKTLPSGVIYVTPGIYLTGGTTAIQQADTVLLNTTDYLQDLGTLRVPPWLAGESGLQSMDIKLLARKTGGGGLDLDFVTLMPAEQFRVLRAVDTGLAQNAILKDDGVNKIVWAEVSSKKTAQFEARGSELTLVPNRAQRLYFLFANASAGSEILRTHSVRVYYRPRYYTL